LIASFDYIQIYDKKSPLHLSVMSEQRNVKPFDVKKSMVPCVTETMS